MDFPKSVPNVGLVDGRFVDESNVTGQVGSLITAEWGNAMTSEIINVIEAAELVPTEGQNDQLVVAIEKLVVEGFPGAATEEKAGIAKIATGADFNAAVPDDTKLVTVRKVKSWFSSVMVQATESIFGWSKIATHSLTNAGTDDATIVTPKKLGVRLAGQTVSSIPIVSGAQVVINHSLGVIPSKVEFSLVCVTAQNGWSAGDVIHGSVENQSNVSSGTTGMGVYWYGETDAQVVVGFGNGAWAQPVKGTGGRATITLANFTLTAKIIP